MKVVVVTSKDDAHLPFVSRHFLPSTELIAVDPYGDVGTRDISYGFTDGKLRLFQSEKLIEDVDSVWYRKPKPLDMDDFKGLRSEYSAYVESALTSHLAPIRRHWKDAFWVSDFEALVRAEQKPYQMEVATKAGFRVPPTLITGKSSLAKKFVERYGECVTKTQAYQFPKDKILMTSIITPDQEIDYSGLHIDPMIFQKYIDPAYELRVSVVGKEIFAARVGGKEIDEKGDFRDWHYSHINGTFFAKEDNLDRATSESCLRLVHELNLQFGAIDLIVDKSGEVWFLEINPNGQWAFIEEHTGQPIGEAIARLLEYR